jgi:hypothetical protein
MRPALLVVMFCVQPFETLAHTTNSLDSDLSKLPPSGAENEAMSHGRTGWPGKFTQSLAAFKRLLCPTFRPT